MNFRDIVVALGMIVEHHLGSECAGVIRRVGRQISPKAFKPGDRVLALVSNQGPHGIIDWGHGLCYSRIIGPYWLYGILLANRYGSTSAGEYCLIHSAAGGVGQIAVRIAQMIGAKVLATVGSESKPSFLKGRFGLTDDAISSSRDPDSFVQGALKATGGHVALDSLAGPFLLATWNIVAPSGRLIEIGKRDIHENFKLDMDPFGKNLVYAGVDIDLIAIEGQGISG